jgi:hypothetical protein
MTNVERRTVVTTLVGGLCTWEKGGETDVFGCMIRLGGNWRYYALDVDEEFFLQQDMNEQVVRTATFSGEEPNQLTALEVGGRTLRVIRLYDLSS